MKRTNFVHAWTMHYGWMYFVSCAKIKSSQVIKSNSFHYLSQQPIDFTITHQFYIENIYNSAVCSLADLLALLFAREEISSKCAFGSKFKIQFIFTTIHRFHCSFCIALLKATNALFKVSTKISKFPHSWTRMIESQQKCFKIRKPL